MPGLAQRHSREKANPLFLGALAVRGLSRFSRTSEAQPKVDSRAEEKWKYLHLEEQTGELEAHFLQQTCLQDRKRILERGAFHGHLASELQRAFNFAVQTALTKSAKAWKSTRPRPRELRLSCAPSPPLPLPLHLSPNHCPPRCLFQEALSVHGDRPPLTQFTERQQTSQCRRYEPNWVGQRGLVCVSALPLTSSVVSDHLSTWDLHFLDILIG